jgi:hypothetical protein
MLLCKGLYTRAWALWAARHIPYSFSTGPCFFLLKEMTTAAIATPSILRSPARKAIMPAGLVSAIIPSLFLTNKILLHGIPLIYRYSNRAHPIL